ncbi:MAG: DNA/RNA helicase domain-containing protein, partial [Candidatus Aminicenantales bacterium]
MKREYYSDTIKNFLKSSIDEVYGKIAQGSDFPVELSQRSAWLEEIDILRRVLAPYDGAVYFEYSIPRMGERIDVVLIIGSVIFVLEFKTGAKEFTAYAIDQVTDYALDLKNFHETSHDPLIAPVLIATRASGVLPIISMTPQNDKLLRPVRTNTEQLDEVIKNVLAFSGGEPIDWYEWRSGRYSPTPTIMEAALVLYRSHSVADISRSDASAINLSQTSDTISEIIQKTKARAQKAICFVTGVPGAGKTLVGLNIATKYIDKADSHHSVFLSGNGPLVNILQEALARDMVSRTKARGRKIKKGEAKSRVKAFIQNVHHFRDECLVDEKNPPIDHVALFDEAQRAWNRAMTADFMQRKKKRSGFDASEPEFLISCLDRHPDWAVIICLVGGGQEINRGEAGITEWIESLMRRFPDWHVYISPRLTDSEYGAGEVLKRLESHRHVSHLESLHLSVSMRSFRSEKVSAFVKSLLDLDANGARDLLTEVSGKYPIALTRDLGVAKQWIHTRARGSERYGLVASSEAQRLKPHAIDIRVSIDP